MRQVGRPRITRPETVSYPGGWPKRVENQFCDLIANGMSIAAAGRVVGVTAEAAKSKWSKICAKYGEQAH